VYVYLNFVLKQMFLFMDGEGRVRTLTCEQCFIQNICEEVKLEKLAQQGQRMRKETHSFKVTWAKLQNEPIFTS
jgi:hypothetical protein